MFHTLNCFCYVRSLSYNGSETTKDNLVTPTAKRTSGVLLKHLKGCVISKFSKINPNDSEM